MHWRTKLRRAAGRLLAAGTPVQDLLLRAKHLFVAATFRTTTNPPSVQARPCCGAGGRPSRGAILRALNKKSPTIRAAGQDFHRLLGASLCAGARFLQANGGPRPCRPSAYPIPSSTP
jgi:hypothetical protein